MTAIVGSQESIQEGWMRDIIFGSAIDQGCFLIGVMYALQVTHNVACLARWMAADLYLREIDVLRFEVRHKSSVHNRITKVFCIAGTALVADGLPCVHCLLLELLATTR